MKTLLLLLPLFLFCRITAFPQVLPDSLRVDWSTAGYPGTIPQPPLVLNVNDFGAYGDSVHDDYAAIITAINSSSSFRVIYFPAGNYIIQSSLRLPPNVVLRGAGTASHLIFRSFTGNCISVDSTQTSGFTAVSAGYSKSSTQLTLANANGFVVNGYAELREINGSWDTQPASWATYNVGQIVKVTAIAGNTITIEPALRIDYSASLQPQIRPVFLKQNIGIECLAITRGDTVTNQYGYNINFSYAGNCWVTGVESNKSQGAHIMLSGSSHITISGCYFHEAYNYSGTGTAGYGVTMIAHNSDCKVENCIFRHLRHSMVAKQGANGNIFAYNYSLDPNRTEMPTDGGADMLLHGHYAFANLFEGNIGQTIAEDDTWGPSGPYNTFFRNRAELYGILIYNQAVTSDRQNVIGNEVTNTDYTNGKGNYSIFGNNQFTYGNNINGVIQPAGTGSLTDSSYYLTKKPYFWDIAAAWPSTGIPNTLGSGTNPARERYLASGTLTSCPQETGNTTSGCSSLRVGFTALDARCFSSNDGSITVHAGGGTLPYLYSRDSITYQADSVLANLAAGTYDIWLKDAAGCAGTIRGIAIAKPTAMVVSASATMANNCRNSGTITLKVTGGTAPYLYSLNDTLHYVTNALFTGLGAGSYTGYVKDAHGCVSLLTGISVGKTGAITVTATKTTTSYCLNDGSITLKASGGVAPYTYSLTDTLHFTANAVFGNLAAGTYTGYVKDSKGCIASLANIVITKGTAVTLTATTTVASVCLNDGNITLKASGGTAPYTYSLTDTVHYSSVSVFSGLAAGTYTAYIRDGKGCVGTLSNIVIKRAAAIAITATKTAASACKDDGSITLKASGGTTPYQYSLPDSMHFSAAALFSNLAAGTYTGWAKDAKGCTASLTGIAVTKTAALTATGSKTDVSCLNGTDGIVTLKASGGTSAYLYSLNGGAFVSSGKFTGLSAGSYTGTVKDAKGCTATSSVITVNNGTKACPQGMLTSEVMTNNIKTMNPNEFFVSVFPNPSGSQFHLRITGSSLQEANIYVSDVTGKSIETWHRQVNTDFILGRNWHPGVYLVRVAQRNRVAMIKVVKTGE